MARATSIVIALVCVAVVSASLIAAFTSPLLAWRSPVYIVAGFAGVLTLPILLLQPLLALNLLPKLNRLQSKRLHRAAGVVLCLMVLVHVVGLWITSPPDVIDALLFASPTPFSLWGVISMWSIVVAAVFVTLRRKINTRVWRLIHKLLAVVTALGAVLHAIKIDGTMELITKSALCGLVVLAIGWMVASGLLSEKEP